ncbi:Protein phosphatase 1K, mitochondrial [Portunus trituberculatus]|uniref:Protein phosphatase 1K, mitochondrial n=1 Tax=Portunus trituberculatus TaxID=210409 RepID=A0A5B7G0L1_PORTR|nr:Protein phosphatase 1K, mitochondrial [Portunus trituberculatus]
MFHLSKQCLKALHTFRYVVEDLPNNILCAAVFDGHGGAECSEYCAQNLRSVLREELRHHKDLEAVLHHTFLKLHTGYIQWTKTHNAGERAGTTAAVSLLRGGVELAVGHVGDSRVILCRLGVSRELTRDHCPSLISEKDRITKCGGSVSVDNIGRHMVNDTLSMSRSIGDLHLKKYGVIALPDTRTMRIKHGKDAFLLLITDGVNFVLQSKEACDIINQAEDPNHAAQLLTEQISVHCAGMMESDEEDVVMLIVSDLDEEIDVDDVNDDNSATLTASNESDSINGETDQSADVSSAQTGGWVSVQGDVGPPPAPFTEVSGLKHPPKSDDAMHKNNTATGTVQINRKELLDKAVHAKLEQHQALEQRKGPLLCVVYKDGKRTPVAYSDQSRVHYCAKD